jgi:glycolate oxidase iron-sulfur subunit
MQTHFSPEQLNDSRLAAADAILRTCVHCGMCTSTCPTYVTLGDELDSPRGRIYLMKDMFENDRPATKDVVQHLDRCLSCLSCMTTCPSSVDYMHLVDLGRQHVEATYKRPLMDRLTRQLLAALIPYHRRFGLAMKLGWLARPFRALAPTARMRAMMDLVPEQLPLPEPTDKPGVYEAVAEARYRVAILPGCAQRALAPSINAATLRILQRHGCQVTYPDVGCCGSLRHHMGADALGEARAMVDAIWALTKDGGGRGLDAFVINASGCGTTVKDYGHMLADDPAYADKAAAVAGLAKDITEWLEAIGLAPARPEAAGLRVTYHSACSMQHGQQIKTPPLTLLSQAGFAVSQPRNGHLCCGSAGTYNIMQPEIAGQLLERKVETLAETAPQIIVAGNIGCISQIGRGLSEAGEAAPILHTAELLDWATGGPEPAALEAVLAGR